MTLGRLAICIGRIQVGLGSTYEAIDEGFDALREFTGTNASLIVKRNHPLNGFGDRVLGDA